MTKESLLATISYHEVQVNPFYLRRGDGLNLYQKYSTRSHSSFSPQPHSVSMIHFQISVKLNETLHQRLTKTASQMRMNKHAFVVNSLEETLNLIDNRDCEKLPLLVVQARTAQDYVKQAPMLPKGSEAGPPEKLRKTHAPEPAKSAAKNKSKPASPPIPKSR